MNSSYNNSPKTKLIFGAWTALWLIASISVSSTLWLMQHHQAAVWTAGMKTQSTLLIGGSDDVAN